MYHVFKIVRGERELLETFENAKDAAVYEDKARKNIRTGANSGGVFADVATYTTEELERIREAAARYETLTDEEKNDHIVVDGKKYIRKIYEGRKS